MDLKETISEYLKNTDNTVEYSKTLTDKLHNINEVLSEKLSEELKIDNLTQLIETLKNKKIKEQRTGDIEVLITKHNSDKSAGKYNNNRFVETDENIIITNSSYVYQTYDNTILVSNKLKGDNVLNSEYNTIYSSRDNFMFGHSFKNSNNEVFVFTSYRDIKKIDIITGTMSDVLSVESNPLLLTNNFILINGGKKINIDTFTVTDTQAKSDKCSILDNDNIASVVDDKIEICDLKTDSITRYIKNEDVDHNNIISANGEVIFFKKTVLDRYSVKFDMVDIESKDIINSFTLNKTTSDNGKNVSIKEVSQSGDLAIICVEDSSSGSNDSYYVDAVFFYNMKSNIIRERFRTNGKRASGGTTNRNNYSVSNSQGSLFLSVNEQNGVSTTPEYKVIS